MLNRKFHLLSLRNNFKNLIRFNSNQVFQLTPQKIDDFVLKTWPAITRHTFCREISPQHCLVEKNVRKESIRPGGLVSGPTMFYLADVALWYLSFGCTGKLAEMAVTSEMSIRFLRPANTDTLMALATLNSVGKKKMIGTVHVYDNDPLKPLAVAQGTYVFPKF